MGTRWRWLDTPVSLRLWFWLAPALAAVVGGILRFVRLGDPHALVFDETYYVKDAYSLLQSGYERNWADKANDHFMSGDFSVPAEHPGVRGASARRQVDDRLRHVAFRPVQHASAGGSRRR